MSTLEAHKVVCIPTKSARVRGRAFPGYALRRGTRCRFSRQLAALRDLPSCARAVPPRSSRSCSPEESISACSLAGLAKKAHRRTNPSSTALEGALRACRLYLSAEQLEAMRGAATVANEEELMGLLSQARAPVRSSSIARAWVDRGMRARSLGERKTVWRAAAIATSSPGSATDPDPGLRSSARSCRTLTRHGARGAHRCARDDLARAAPLLEEIFRSPRWAQEPPRPGRDDWRSIPTARPRSRPPRCWRCSRRPICARWPGTHKSLDRGIRVQARRLLADRREACNALRADEKQACVII